MSQAFMFAKIVTYNTILTTGGENVVESVRIGKREHFKIMSSVFEEVIDNPDYKTDKIREALTLFSNKAHKKIFSSAAERGRISPRVERITREVLDGK